jgi:HD superfamily phosphohydrolase
LFLDKTSNQEFDGTGNIIVDKIIRDFCNKTERHCILGITFSEMFQKVWNRIATQENIQIKIELIKRLKEEMIDAKDKCFFGQITRLVNTLVGFYDDISIEMDENEQIYEKVLANKNRNNQVVNIKELEMELREIKISEQKITEWINALIDQNN